LSHQLPQNYRDRKKFEEILPTGKNSPFLLFMQLSPLKTDGFSATLALILDPSSERPGLTFEPEKTFKAAVQLHNNWPKIYFSRTNEHG
jgi:hypothetical protein